MKTSKFTLRRMTVGVIAAAAALASFGAGAAIAEEFTGAGATFPAPIYTRWGEQYSASSGDALNYQGVGSGAGVTQIINRTVDFGASDTAGRARASGQQQFAAIPGRDRRRRRRREHPGR